MKIKLSLKEKTVPEKIQLMREVVNAMSENPNFPTPDPSLTQVISNINTLSAAYNEAQDARLVLLQKTDVLRSFERNADETISFLASYVENTSEGDSVIIESAGMQVRREEPSGLLPVPENVRVLEGESNGEVHLMWHRMFGASGYEVQMTQEVSQEASWMHICHCTRSKVSVKNLLIGQRYWFRVAMLGLVGQGSFSEPVSRIVT